MLLLNTGACVLAYAPRSLGGPQRADMKNVETPGPES